MYKSQKIIVLVSVNVFAIASFILICLFLLPKKDSSSFSIYTFLVTVIIFLAVVFWGNRIRAYLISYVRKHTLESGETVILNNFIDRLRFCYSLDDFYTAIGDVLEKQGDCSVLLVDRVKNYTLYNSPNRLSTADDVKAKLDSHFTDSWQDGFFYFDRHIGVTTNYRKSRGFFMCYEKQQLYVFCRYTRLYDVSVYTRLFE